MGRPLKKLQRFFRELKRRNVYQVAVTYAVVAFVTLQAAQLIFPATTLEGLYDKLVVLAFVGFPISLVIAWAFEMTPEGVRRTETRERAESPGARFQWIGLALVVTLAGGLWYFTAGSQEKAPIPETATARDSVRAGSIAVLPFENMGGKGSEQFTQGVHDGLLTRLSNISDLKVISRTSVMRYEDTDKPISEIARDLGVGWVVEGAVQESGGEVQVNAQLIDAREDAHQWAQTYRRELNPENLFAIQSELTKKIARSLEAEVSPQEEERLERRPTEELEAYRAYQSGRHHWYQHTEENWRRAVDDFSTAIAIDSTYAPAFAGLADALSSLAFFGHLEPGRAYRRARRAAERALELDETLAEAHTTLARLRYTYQWDFESAELEFKRALELNPNYASGHHAYAVFLARMARFEEAEKQLKTALALDPLKPRINNNRGWIRFLARDYREAIIRYEDALELNPEFAMTHRELGWAYVEVGEYRNAIRESERAAELSGDDYTLASLGFVLGQAGEHERARAVLDRLKVRDDQRYVSPTNLALVHLGLGNPDRAMDWLEQAAQDRSSFLVNSAVHPFFDPLRPHPRFQRLLERVGLDTVSTNWEGTEGAPPDPSSVESQVEGGSLTSAKTSLYLKDS